MNPKLSPYPREFLEGSDEWIGVYGKSQDKLGVFDLSGALLQPVEPPIKNLVGLDKFWVGTYMISSQNKHYRMQWEFNAPDSSSSRYFVRIGTKFEERKVPPGSTYLAAVSYDGQWVAVMDIGESRVYKDGVVKEKLSFPEPAKSAGVDAIRDLINQYVFRRRKADGFWTDAVTGFDLHGRRRIGHDSGTQPSQGYIQLGADRFYASELGIRPKNDKGEFPGFLYISPDGRRFIGDNAEGYGAFVFAIDR
jgi:hypothetical protein